MTDLTINQVYAIGAPIVLAMILIEVFFSSIYNKNLYKKDDTLCTIGLLTGNILMVFALKGITLALHFYLFQFKLFNLSALMPVWALWILTFVMIDLVFYFYHRISHSVLTTPATAIMVGSKPNKGNTIKNGNFDIGPNQACLKDTEKFISSLE